MEICIESKDFRIVADGLFNLGTIKGNLEASFQKHGRSFKELSDDELMAIARLYSKVKPIDFTELIRFKHRIVPILFLIDVDEEIEGLDAVSDDDLARLIVARYQSDSRFRKQADKKFFNNLEHRNQL